MSAEQRDRPQVGGSCCRDGDVDGRESLADGLMDPEQFTRDIEAYLCRKNDGHLVRIVGPSFERVCRWALQGVPFKVACAGIDRCFDRYYAKGPRRRPVRIDFCEADVLDVFDDWRRAVGVRGVAAGTAESVSAGSDEERRRPSSLPAHLERVIARLTLLRAGGQLADQLDATLDRAIRAIDAARTGAKQARGSARAELIARLREIDRDVLRALLQACPSSILDAVRHEAEAQLAPFQPRMTDEAFRSSLDACVERLVRDRTGLPYIALD